MIPNNIDIGRSVEDVRSARATRLAGETEYAFDIQYRHSPRRALSGRKKKA